MSVLGRMVKLDDTRIVFLGTSDKQPDTYYLAFRSKEDIDTKLVLTGEAMRSLTQLINDPEYGLPLCDFPHKSTWELVSDRDEGVELPP